MYDNEGYFNIKYRMNNRKLKFLKSYRLIPGYRDEVYEEWFPEKFTYEFSDDSSFTLINTCGNCKSIIGVHKAPTRTYQSLEDIRKIYQQKIDSATVKEIILVKNDSTKKEVALKTKGRIELYTDSLTACEYTLSVNYFVEKVASIKDPLFLYVYPSGMEKSTDYCNGYYGKNSKTFFAYSLGSSFVPVRKSDIKYIVYYKPGEYGTYRTLHTIGWLSFFTGIFIAPIASLKFSNPGFNSRRYLTIAGASLFTMTVSFSLKSFFNGKQYLIGNKYGKNGWHFE